MTAAPDYLAQFEAAAPRRFNREIEYEIERGGEELAISLPIEDGQAPAAAIASARSVLAELDALDGAAKAYLFDLPGWPHGDDADLWLLLVRPGDVRLCYAQSSVNDEQVVGFSHTDDGWTLAGLDSRLRA